MPAGQDIDRDLLVQVLIYHQQVDGPPGHPWTCACGWGTRPEHLGCSWAAHVVDVYEIALREDR